MNGLSLVRTAVEIALKKNMGLGKATLTVIAFSILDLYEGFDNEPVDPEFFAEKILVHAGRIVETGAA